MKTLEKKPENRFQSASELRVALSAIDEDPTMATLLEATTLPRSESKDPPLKGKDSAAGGSTLSGAPFLSDVSRELANYIGPIARVVVNRAASKCFSVEELYSSVAAEIADEAQRRRFMSTRTRFSGLSSSTH
jgi:serine/threonine-protein kinase